MDNLADTLWQEFAAEADEHLQTVEPILSRSDPRRVDGAEIAQLFRSFHSIKGLARAMDLRGMEGVAHHAENLLGLVRDGRATLTLERADLLLQAVDALKRMRDAAVERHHDAAAEPALIARLAAAFAAGGGAAGVAVAGGDAPDRAAPAAPEAGLHQDPEMLAIFAEMVEARGPELCAALAADRARRAIALDAAETLAHAAAVMNFDALAAGLAGLHDALMPLAGAGRLDDASRRELLLRLADIRLQIALLAEVAGRDAGASAFAQALAPHAGDETQRLAQDLDRLNRQVGDNLLGGDRLAAEADAAAMLGPLRALRAVSAALGRSRAADVVLLIEDLYGRVAAGEAALADAAVDAAGAAIGGLVAHAATGGAEDLDAGEADRLVARLRGLAASAAQKALQSGHGLIAGLSIPAELSAILSDDNVAALERGVRQEGLFPYDILVHLESEPDIARRLVAWLSSQTRAITNRTVLKEGESWFEMLVLAALEPTALIAALRSVDPEDRCIKRVRRLTESAAGEPVLDRVAEAGPGGDAVRRFAATNTIRVRGEVIDALLDEIGEFRVAAATLRYHILGSAAQAILARARTFAARLTPELRGEFIAIVGQARDRNRLLAESEEALAGMLSRLHQNALELRVVPVDVVLNRLPRAVRDLAQQHGKSVELVLEGRDVRVDKSMVEALADPLIHMIRNAIDHGIEPPDERRAAGKPERGRLTVRAAERGSEIHIEIADDGRGLALDALRAKAVQRGLLSPAQAADLPDDRATQLIFEAGLSTAAAVSETSGRGVGMDVVLANVRRFDGDISVRSEPGRGTTFLLVLPVSAALQTALIVRVGDQSLAIPERHILSVSEIESGTIRLIGNHRSILHRQAVLPLYGLGALLGLLDGSPPGGERVLTPVVVATNGRQMIGLEVDQIEQRQELFLKELDPRIASFPGVGGASVLGDGRVVLVLDGEELIQLAARGVERAPAGAARLAS